MSENRRSNAVVSAFNWLIEFHCDEFRNFVKFNEEHFQKEDKKLAKQYDTYKEVVVDKTDRETLEYVEFLKDDVIDKSQQLLNFEYRYRESVIIQLCSFLEIELKRFCKHYAHLNSKIDEYNNSFGSTGNNVDSAEKFLSKHANIDLKEDKELSTFIKHMLKLRHHIVHHGSLIHKKDRYFPSVNSLFKGNYSLRNKGYSDKFVIEIDNPDFLIKCVDNVERLLNIANDRK